MNLDFEILLEAILEGKDIQFGELIVSEVDFQEEENVISFGMGGTY